MQEVDAAIIAAVQAEGLPLYNANVPTDQQNDTHPTGAADEPRIVTVDLPYGVLYANFGDDNAPRLGGRTSQRSKFFQVNSVGSTPEQAQWAAARVRRALKDRRLVVFVPDPVTGEQTDVKYRMGRIGVEESQRVRRDDATTDPNGNPLFFLTDNFSVRVSNKR